MNKISIINIVIFDISIYYFTNDFFKKIDSREEPIM